MEKMKKLPFINNKLQDQELHIAHLENENRDLKDKLRITEKRLEDAEILYKDKLSHHNVQVADFSNRLKICQEEKENLREQMNKLDDRLEEAYVKQNKLYHKLINAKDQIHEQSHCCKCGREVGIHNVYCMDCEPVEI